MAVKAGKRVKRIQVFLEETYATSDGKRGSEWLELPDGFNWREGVLPKPWPMHPFDDNPYESQLRVYGMGKREHYVVGGVYSVESPADKPTSVFSNSREYLGRWGDDEMLVRWAGIARARVLEHEVREREKKDRLSNPVKERLEPVRKAYMTLRGRSRVLFLAEVVSYITGGKD